MSANKAYRGLRGLSHVVLECIGGSKVPVLGFLRVVVFSPNIA